jgi:hypothetical protein
MLYMMYCVLCIMYCELCMMYCVLCHTFVHYLEHRDSHLHLVLGRGRGGLRRARERARGAAGTHHLQTVHIRTHQVHVRYTLVTC